MALAKSFEEMFSWKHARVLNKLIYEETNKIEFAKDYALKDQIRKSSISIMSNIAEGFERPTKKEFRYFLGVARGSAGELRSQLFIARDLEYMNEESFNECYKKITKISKLLKGFMDSLSEAINKDLKYVPQITTSKIVSEV